MLDLLTTHQPHPLPVASMVRAGEILGVDAAAIRVALSRLSRQGWVRAPSRGVYALAPYATAVADHVRSWRSLEDRVRPWAGGWIGVATGGLSRTDRAAVRARERALQLLGFAELRPGLSIRPDNLVVDAEAVARQLASLGLEDSAVVFGLGPLGPHQASATALWDGAALDRAYREHREALEACAASWAHDPVSEGAARDTWLAGGAVLRLLAFDPLLPSPIVDIEARRALVARMREFDDLGRAAWRHVLDLPSEEAS